MPRKKKLANPTLSRNQVELAMRRRRRTNDGMADIAQALGVSRDALYMHLTHYNITPPPRRTLSDTRVRALHERQVEGESLAALGQEAGVTGCYLGSRMRALGLKPRRGRPPAGTNRATRSRRAEVRDLASELCAAGRGITVSDVVESLGVSRYQASQALQGLVATGDLSLSSRGRTHIYVLSE